VAYLTAEAPVGSPLAACFEVLETIPFSVARLRQLRRRRDWQADEIRRRAFPVEPDDLRRQLGQTGSERVALLCTTVAGRRLVVVGRRVGAIAQGCRQ
jgi:hypothetical protein